LGNSKKYEVDIVIRWGSTRWVWNQDQGKRRK
jgi:hypothetical protein